MYNKNEKQLLEQNIGLARNYAEKAYGASVAPLLGFREQSIQRGDLLQAAKIGLLVANRTYDPDRASFSTWAHFKIRAEISNALHEGGLKDPENRAFAAEYRAAEEILDGVKGIGVSRSDILHYVILNTKKDTVANIARGMLGRTSPGVYADEISSWNDPEPRDLHGIVQDAIETLPPEDASLLKSYYYGGMSFADIGRDLDRARETISGRHKTVLNRVRKYILGRLGLPSEEELQFLLS